MATKIEWETLKGHAGLQYRRFGSELSFRFRQRQYAIDFLGVMPQEKAIRIAGELRDNRSTGAGPQTWKEMQNTLAEQAVASAIIEKKERKRVIAEERLALENTVIILLTVRWLWAVIPQKWILLLRRLLKMKFAHFVPPPCLWV